MRKLTVIMPVFNEEDTVKEAIERSLEVDLNPLEVDIIAVDDSSTDATSKILEDFNHREDVQVIRHEQNMGKGAAIRTALPYVTGEMVIIEDADLETDPNDYHELIKPIINDEADVVFGSRFKGTIENMKWTNYLANRILSLVASILFFKWVTDEATCYKVFRTEVLRSLDLDCVGFEFCPEVTAKVLKRGYRYKEVPISYHGRPVHHGKKIKARDGFRAIYTLIKYRFKA